MNDVFISYKSEDREVAQRVRGSLSLSLRCSIWWDQELQTGGKWSEAIDRALSEAGCIVVLWSTRSVASQWVQMEAAVAKSMDKLVPALIDDCTVPQPYSQFESAHLEQWDGSEKHQEFVKLVVHVRRLLSRTAARTVPSQFGARQRWHNRHPRGLGIGFIGADGTGKTTLVNDLKRLNPKIDIRYSHELARKVIARGYPLGKDASPESFLVLMRDHLDALYNMCRNRVPFISGRTLLDPLCYARVNKTLPRPAVSDNLIALMYKIWLLEQEYYATYLYFPIQFDKIEDDGVRVVDRNYQMKIDREFQQLIENNDIPVTTIIGSRNERVQLAMAAIAEVLGTTEI